jgi:hypothetical protein
LEKSAPDILDSSDSSPMTVHLYRLFTLSKLVNLHTSGFGTMSNKLVIVPSPAFGQAVGHPPLSPPFFILSCWNPSPWQIVGCNNVPMQEVWCGPMRQGSLLFSEHGVVQSRQLDSSYKFRGRTKEICMCTSRKEGGALPI